MTKSLINEQQQRLQQSQQTLLAEWELRSEKLKRLRTARAIEADTAVEFKLGIQIQNEEAKLNEINCQLSDIEAQLQLLSHTKIIPYSTPQSKAHQTFEVLSSTEAIEVFVYHSKQDEKLRNNLEKSLHNMEIQGDIKLWYQKKIRAGKDINFEINKQLNSSHIILLLISPNFMVDYHQSEVKKAIEKCHAQETNVIPILLIPVASWQSIKLGNSRLGNLQYLPKNGKFVTDSRFWKNQNEAFVQIAEEFAETVQQIADETD
ncbi:toll/interleukin-1 receptor domain-containing protein [Nostoc sp. CCY 9925]|uniref:toll/interleukin-1 receptor domain-containing protein n=1 Tax=Nostoc sp. CCY 9925 TaxID=3103865 RepID=UPI0039C62E3F